MRIWLLGGGRFKSWSREGSEEGVDEEKHRDALKALRCVFAKGKRGGGVVDTHE